VFIFPFLHTFALFVTFATLFGLFIAAYISTTSVILVDLVGIDKLTTSFGLITMFRGTAAVLGPPIAGAVFESTQSFTASFLMAGGFFLASGLLRQRVHSPPPVNWIKILYQLQSVANTSHIP
jgi:MFS family permease